MRLPSLTPHELLLMWTQLLVIVLTARLLGGLMRRIGQPPVVGELLAGVLLGPSVLARVWPAGERWVVPTGHTAAAPLNALGWVGVAMLLVLTGFETDLRIVRRLGRPATLVALGGLLLPFVAGLGLGVGLPPIFHGARAGQVAFVLFIAVSLSISSLPVIAKILDELGFMRRNFGQVTVAVGMANDLVGWVALGIITAVARSRSLSPGALLLPLVGIAVFMAGAFTVGRRGVDGVLRRVRRRDGSNVDAMAVTMLVTFAFAVLTQAVRSDAVLGAYVAGIVIGASRFHQRRVAQHLESLTLSVFAPLFFASAGLRIDLAALARPATLLWSGVLLLVAVATKVAGAWAGARAGRLHARESLALAVALNARGAVEVVIATVGLSVGVLSPAAYTAVVLMAIVTSVIAPPLLRLVTHGWEGTREEQDRLGREEAMASNLVVRSTRLLLPSRGGASSVTAARVVDAVWPPEVAVTVLSVGGPGRSDAGGSDADVGEADVGEVVAALGPREVEVQRASGDDPLDAVLAELRLGYGAVVVGAHDRYDPGSLLSPVVDDLLGRSPVPMVVVRRGTRDRYRLDATRASFRRALVPVAGTPAARTAQEVAYNMSRSAGTEIVLTHVTAEPYPAEPGTPGPAISPREVERAVATTTAAAGVIEQAVSLAEEHQVRPRTSVRSGTAAQGILQEAAAQDVDVIVLGTTVRRLDERVFLGHTVEDVLARADSAVIVVATPDQLVAEGIADRHV